MSNYEERLLQELRSLVESRPAGHVHRRAFRPGRRLALAGGLITLLAVAATAGVFFLSTGTQAAYAVTKDANGTVTVEIDSLNDAAGLQTALQNAGVNAVVEYLPEGKACRQPWFTPLGREPGESHGSSVEHLGNGGVRFTISGDIPAEGTLVVTTQTGPGREVALGLAYAQGDVPPCDVVDAPAGSGPLGGPPPDTSGQAGQG